GVAHGPGSRQLATRRHAAGRDVDEHLPFPSTLEVRVHVPDDVATADPELAGEEVGAHRQWSAAQHVWARDLDELSVGPTDRGSDAVDVEPARLDAPPGDVAAPVRGVRRLEAGKVRT